MIKKELNRLTVIIIVFFLLSSFMVPFAFATKPTTPRIKIRPTEGKPGDIIKIHGKRFTPIEGTEVTLRLYFESGDSVELKDLETDKKGKFRGTFMVPAVVAGDYTLVVEDSYGLSVSVLFRVDPYIP